MWPKNLDTSYDKDVAIAMKAARKYAKRSSRLSPDELLGDAWIGIENARRKFDSLRSIWDIFAFHLACHAIVDRLRKDKTWNGRHHKAQEVTDETLVVEAEDFIPDDPSDPLFILSDHLDRAGIVNPDRRRMAIKRWVLGQSTARIGEYFGISKYKVSRYLTEMRKRIQNSLKD